MRTSEQINELATALAKAQGKIESAKKETTNSHFKSRYADLASVWDACRKPLTDHGLSVVQGLSTEENRVKCTTMLLHTSGQYISTELTMTPQQNTPQAVGSCATYLRRYSLQAIVGIAPDDDDGNEASAVGKYQAPTTGRANDYNTTAKANPTTAPNPSSITTQAAKDLSNTAANPQTIFDGKNPAHVEGIKRIAEQQRIPGRHFASLIKAMEGKAANARSVLETWNRINPEAPDAPPAGE